MTYKKPNSANNPGITMESTISATSTGRSLEGSVPMLHFTEICFFQR
jgi:hypothetical protein